MTRLLAAEDPALAVERLEHIAVADVGRDDPDAVLLHQSMEAEVRHRRHGDELDTEVECEHRDDLVAVDGLAARIDREHPIAVAVERDPEVEASTRDELLQRAEIRGAAADVDVRPVGLVADRLDLCAELLERLWRDACVRPVRAVDGEPEAGEVGAEALEHVLEVAVDCDVDAIDLAAARRGRVEQRLDLLFGGVAELAPAAVEELDAVVLGRVVRRGDDDSEVEPQQRHRRCRHDASDHRRSAGRGHAARKRLLELLAGATGVAADEDAPAARPERRGLAEPLEQLGRDELANDPADTVGAEVGPRHSLRG